MGYGFCNFHVAATIKAEMWKVIANERIPRVLNSRERKSGFFNDGPEDHKP